MTHVLGGNATAPVNNSTTFHYIQKIFHHIWLIILLDLIREFFPTWDFTNQTFDCLCEEWDTVFASCSGSWLGTVPIHLYVDLQCQKIIYCSIVRFGHQCVQKQEIKYIFPNQTLNHYRNIAGIYKNGIAWISTDLAVSRLLKFQHFTTIFSTEGTFLMFESYLQKSLNRDR